MSRLEKPAEVSVPLIDAIASRWSPVGFADRPVDPATLRACLEAARWAPSCYNEQPWAVLVTRKPDAAREQLFACLSERNRSWAHAAPVLLLAVARERFSKNGKPNRHAQYDTGQAVAMLIVQATALGLHAHQMAGFDAGQAARAFGIPADATPMAVVAIGHLGEVEDLSADLREREESPRSRRPLGEIARAESWDGPSAFPEE
jgi:nitroreductase